MILIYRAATRKMISEISGRKCRILSTTFWPAGAQSTFTFFKPDQNGNSVAFIQCKTVGFASVIVCFASMSADFAKEAVFFFKAGLLCIKAPPFFLSKLVVLREHLFYPFCLPNKRAYTELH